MIRVLHVLEASGFGTGRHLVDLVTTTRTELRHHVVLPPRRVTRGEPVSTWTADRLAELGVEVHLVPMRRLPPHPDNLRAVRRIRGLIGVLEPDVVHGHAAVGGALARLAARGTAARRVYTPHGFFPSRAVLVVERRLARFTDAIVAVSDSERDLAVKKRLCAPSQVVVIPNGIALDEVAEPVLDIRRRFELPSSAPVIGFVGRLARQKGSDTLLKALGLLARRWHHIHVVLVGGGPWMDATESEIERLHLGGIVHRIPYLQGASSVMPQFDVLAFPSRWEGGPYVPLEAMLAGTPIVVTDVTGNRDLVEHGYSGLVIPPEDPVALAHALSLLVEDPGLRARLADNAHQRLAEKFDVRHMGAAHLRLYEQLAGAGSAA